MSTCNAVGVDNTFVDKYCLCGSSQILVLTDSLTGACQVSCSLDTQVLLKDSFIYLCYASADAITPFAAYVTLPIVTAVASIIPNCDSFVTPFQCYACSNGGVLNQDCRQCAQGYIFNQEGYCDTNYATLSDFEAQGIITNNTELGTVGMYGDLATAEHELIPWCTAVDRYDLDYRIQLCRSLYQYPIDSSIVHYMTDISYFIGVDSNNKIVYRPNWLMYFECDALYISDRYNFLYQNFLSNPNFTAPNNRCDPACKYNIFQFGSDSYASKDIYNQYIQKLGAINYAYAFSEDTASPLDLNNQNFRHYTSDTYTFVLNCQGEFKRFYFNPGQFSLQFKFQNKTDYGDKSTKTYVTCAKGKNILNTFIPPWQYEGAGDTTEYISFVNDTEMYGTSLPPLYESVFNYDLQNQTVLCNVSNNFCDMEANEGNHDYNLNIKVHLANVMMYQLTTVAGTTVQNNQKRYYKLNSYCKFITKFTNAFYADITPRLQPYGTALNQNKLTISDLLTKKTHQYADYSSSPLIYTLSPITDFYNFSQSSLTFTIAPKSKFNLINHPIYDRYYDCATAINLFFCYNCFWNFTRQDGSDSATNPNNMVTANFYSQDSAACSTAYARMNSSTYTPAKKTFTGGYIYSYYTGTGTFDGNQYNKYFTKFAPSSYIATVAETSNASGATTDIVYYFTCGNLKSSVVDKLMNIPNTCTSKLSIPIKPTDSSNFYCPGTDTTRTLGNCYNCLLRIGCQYAGIWGVVTLNNPDFTLVTEQDANCGCHYLDSSCQSTTNPVMHNMYSLYFDANVTYPKMAYNIIFSCKVTNPEFDNQVVAKYDSNYLLYIDNGQWNYEYLFSFDENRYSDWSTFKN